jgi:hypothetical protein
LAATIILCMAQAARAQASDPQAVAAELLAADSSGDWRTILRIADPAALVDFRNQQIAMMTLMLNPDPRLTAFMQRALDSTQTRMMAAFRDSQRARMLDSVFQVPSFDSLAALPPDSVLARWYRGLSRGWREDDPHYGIVGTVQPSDSVAYVILELKWKEPPPPDGLAARRLLALQVLVLRKRDAEWRTMLDIVPNPLAGFGAPAGFNPPWPQ